MLTCFDDPSSSFQMVQNFVRRRRPICLCRNGLYGMRVLGSLQDLIYTVFASSITRITPPWPAQCQYLESVPSQIVETQSTSGATRKPSKARLPGRRFMTHCRVFSPMTSYINSWCPFGTTNLRPFLHFSMNPENGEETLNSCNEVSHSILQLAGSKCPTNSSGQYGPVRYKAPKWGYTVRPLATDL